MKSFFAEALAARRPRRAGGLGGVAVQLADQPAQLGHQPRQQPGDLHLRDPTTPAI